MKYGHAERFCIHVRLVPSPEADDAAVTSSQSLARIVNGRPCRAVFFLRFSKEVLAYESTSRTEPGGGAPGNHPQGLRAGTRCDRVPQMEDPVNRPERGQPYVIMKGPLAT